MRAGVGLLVMLVVLGLTLPERSSMPGPSAGTSLAVFLTLALPAYLVGMLSLLSPCCLPILPAYFSFTFGAQRQRVVAMTLTFFLGLATTMVILGASFTALGSLIGPYRTTMTRLGGGVIIGFGLMSVLGKGFSGIYFRDRPAATLMGTYVYGLTFAFGWTACMGPILGAILTTLATTGVSVLAGALLALVYALGLATPLILIATFFRRVGHGTQVWTWLRGRGVSLRIRRWTIDLHTTSVISGLLVMAVGVLLATGHLTWLTQQAAGRGASGMSLTIERWLAEVFGGW